MTDDLRQLELDFAWSAGFLDGEGYFGLVRKTKSKHLAARIPTVSATQRKREPLEKLASLFGSHVCCCITGGKYVYIWHLTKADDLKIMLPLVIPNLVNKKREAEIVLEFTHWMKARGRASNGGTVFTTDEIHNRLALIDEHDAIREANRHCAEIA